MDLGDYLRAAMMLSSVKTSADGKKGKIVWSFDRSRINPQVFGAPGKRSN